MSKKRRVFKKMIKGAVILSVLISLLSIAVNVYVYRYSRGYIFTKVKAVPNSYTALVLGARVYKSGRLSSILYDRVTAALKLYRKGKIKKILLSGDHGTLAYDEVNAMRKFLLKHGVPGKNIFMDHAGFDTYSSMVRAEKIFSIKDAVIVTQRFHLSRSVFIARKMGIKAYGYQADRRRYLHIRAYQMREYLATFKAFLDVVRNRKPKYLGKKIPVTGSGILSWD